MTLPFSLIFGAGVWEGKVQRLKEAVGRMSSLSDGNDIESRPPKKERNPWKV